VEGQAGPSRGIGALGPTGAALLVEARAPDRTTLEDQVRVIEAALADIPTFRPVRFSVDPAECARLWNVRKGCFRRSAPCATSAPP
jgi:D-lactate dehydrogenase